MINISKENLQENLDLLSRKEFSDLVKLKRMKSIDDPILTNKKNLQLFDFHAMQDKIYLLQVTLIL